MARNQMHSTLLGLGLAAGLGLTLSAVAAPDDPGVGNKIDDTAITTKVKATLADDAQLQDSHIRVHTDQGVVTLRGSVISDEQRRHAEHVAENIKGVDSVEDELAVGDSPRTDHPAVARAERVGSDSWITTKVKSELISNQGTHGFDVHVTTEHGVVMLSGSLPDEHDIARAHDVAAQVQGVRRVDTSELHISGGG
jgi:hyperosmotically inducible protein